MRAGATPAFVNWRLSQRELAEVLALVEPKAVAADAEFAGLAGAAWPQSATRVVIGGGPGPAGRVPAGWRDGAALAGPVPPRPALTGDTVLALVHTSGTTGRAKAIPLRHGALMMSVADFAIEIGDQVAGSRHLQILPLFHLGGFGQCLQALLTAGTVYIHTAFNPAAVVDAIEADRIEFFTAGPSLIDMLVAEISTRAHADLSSLREIAYGTAPITPSSLTAALAAFGCRFRQIYGSPARRSRPGRSSPGAGTGWRTSSARRAWTMPPRSPGRRPARCSSGSCARSWPGGLSRRTSESPGIVDGLAQRAPPGPRRRAGRGGRTGRLRRRVRGRGPRRRPGPVPPGGGRDRAGAGGNRGGERGAAAAGAGGQDRDTAGPGGRGPVHPGAGGRQHRDERPVRAFPHAAAPDGRGVRGSHPFGTQGGAATTVSSSVPGWCRWTAGRCGPTCLFTWPRSGRGCSRWRAGSPTA